jgi:hypothetical protein
MSDAAQDPMEIWSEVLETFNPQRPAPPELRAPRETYNPLTEEIVPLLCQRLPHQKYILAGGIGSGKSTELLATADKVTPYKAVIFVDLLEHFTNRIGARAALNHLQSVELIGLLGLATLRAADTAPGVTPEPLRQALAAAISSLPRAADGEPAAPNVDLAKLTKGIAVVVGGLVGALFAGPAGGAAGATAAPGAVEIGLKTLEATAEAFEWKMGVRGRRRTGDEEAPAQAVLSATNALLDNLRQRTGRGVVLVVDGLDRVAEPTTFEDLLIESSLLADLRCDLVVSLELGLVQQYGSRLSGWSCYDFTFVPVADFTSPDAANPTGIEFFVELSHRRFEAIPSRAHPITLDHLKRLAYLSGGRIRDFMTLVRSVATAAIIARVHVAQEKQINKAIDQFRRDREKGLNSLELDTLVEILQDPRRRLPPGEVALELLTKNCLLAYPNRSTWYLPHPILMMHILSTTTTG